MPFRNVVVISDQSDRGYAFAQAARTVARCRVTASTETWADFENVQGVVADISLDNPISRRCLKNFTNKNFDKRTPLIYISRTGKNSELLDAKKHGATACFSAFILPRDVISGLFRQIEPNKTMTDLLVEHSFDRADLLFMEMRKASNTGRIDPAAIEDEIDPVIEALRQGGLQRWLDLVLAHDDTTARHCLLVAGLAANFALYLGLSAVDRIALVRAGIVHDVGKVHIPLEILNKPGPLTAAETLVMRTHSLLGHEMLLASGIKDAAALAVTRHHHEMLDGSGYPDGLQGNQISDMVRLLTVCDIYAALTERRPYRSAMSQVEALAILRAMTPDQLETGLVEAFAASLIAIDPADQREFLDADRRRQQ